MRQHYTAFRSTAKLLSSTDTTIRSQGSAMMRTRLIRKPGQTATKRLVEQYGEQPVCVRYRDDERLCKRFKTVGLFIEEKLYCPAPARFKEARIAGIRAGFKEMARELRYDQALALGLEACIEPSYLPNSRKTKLPNIGKVKLPTIR